MWNTASLHSVMPAIHFDVYVQTACSQSNRVAGLQTKSQSEHQSESDKFRPLSTKLNIAN